MGWMMKRRGEVIGIELQHRCSIRDWIVKEVSIGKKICPNGIRIELQQRCSIRDGMRDWMWDWIRDWIFEEGWVIMW